MRSVFLIALLIACKGNEGKPIEQGSSAAGVKAAPTSPALEDQFDRAMVDLEGYRSRMCACTDVPCTDKVFADFTAWRMELRKSNTDKVRPTKDQDLKGNAIDRDMKLCRAKIAAGMGTASAAGSGSGMNAVDAALVEMAAYKQQMCACTAKPCADKVQAEFATWQRNLRAKMAEKPSGIQEVRGNAIDKEMKDCRKKAETATPGAPGGTSKIDNMLTSMQGFRDKICACTDKACATKIDGEMQTWLVQAAKDIADAKPTKDQDEKADRLQAEMKSCLGKLK